jgi:hypothetical protein
VGDLETLETVNGFGFLSDNVENRVDEFSTFRVVALGPVVTSTGLTKDAAYITYTLVSVYALL